MAAPATEAYPRTTVTDEATARSTREYVRLHDLFGRGGDDVMKTLKRLRDEAKGAAATRGPSMSAAGAELHRSSR